MRSSSRSDLHVQKMWQVAVWWLQETPASQLFLHEPVTRKKEYLTICSDVQVHGELSLCKLD